MRQAYRNKSSAVIRDNKSVTKGVLTSSKDGLYDVGFISFSQMALVSWRIFAQTDLLVPYGSDSVANQ